MTWSARRQLAYTSSFLFVIGVVIFIIIRNATYQVPTCYDGKQNSNEVGVDCGGVCAFYCKAELANPKVRWVRFFPIADDLVHAVAYIEHSYPTAAAREIQYEFKIYDEKNNVLTTRSGSTYLGPMGRTAIVETLIPVGNSIPAIARFSFVGDIPWEKIPTSYSQIVVNTDRYLLERFNLGVPDQVGTRLTATLENQSRTTFKNIDVVAILYDREDNTIAVSKSFLQNLPAKSMTTVYFTWPQDLKDQTSRVEISPRINPFSAVE